MLRNKVIKPFFGTDEVLARSSAEYTGFAFAYYEHTCTFGLFERERKDLRLKFEPSTIDEYLIRRQG